ncbi:MAG: Flp pilus assembly protein CpaB [Planctomycetota bacterium]
MRPKSMILILIALGCGLIASIGISQVVEKNADSGAEAVQTSPIYVAAVDVQIKEELTAQRVKLEEWPVDRIPPGAVTTPEQMEDMVPRYRFFAGEPILLAKLARADEMNSASDKIKPGHRVMSIRVSMDTAVSHLIQPGDHVDILAFIRARGQAPKASTILSGIEVFALNDQTEMLEDGGSSIQAKTVSVQVTPQEASTLMFYAEQGRLRLTLRSRDDTGVATGDVAMQTVEPTPPKKEVEEVVDGDEKWRMQVLDGSGAVRTFAWNDNETLPHEVTEGNGYDKTSEAEEKTSENVPPFGTEGEGLEDEFGGLSGDALEGSDGRNLNLGIEF